mmetsp:Transcript_11483/g.21930  ORF Transcript_11483/g.21930 Transcript_11483/m.21930 type:complete len:259 (-) Transcript_11483:3479-4255(-)
MSGWRLDWRSNNCTPSTILFRKTQRWLLGSRTILGVPIRLLWNQSSNAFKRSAPRSCSQRSWSKLRRRRQRRRRRRGPRTRGQRRTSSPAAGIPDQRNASKTRLPGAPKPPNRPPSLSRTQTRSRRKPKDLLASRPKMLLQRRCTMRLSPMRRCTMRLSPMTILKSEGAPAVARGRRRGRRTQATPPWPPSCGPACASWTTTCLGVLWWTPAECTGGTFAAGSKLVTRRSSSPPRSKSWRCNSSGWTWSSSSPCILIC